MPGTPVYPRSGEIGQCVFAHPHSGTRAARLGLIALCGLVLWPSVLPADTVHEAGLAVEVLRDDLEPDTIPLWQSNACEVLVEQEAAKDGKACLKLIDRGTNAQVFLPVTTVPGLRYSVFVSALRRSSNKGAWLGCAAVSLSGGKGSRQTYAGQSEFIPEAERWSRLTLSFTARSRRAFIILTGQNAIGDVTLFDDLRVTCTGVPPMAPAAEPAVDQSAAPFVVLAGAPLEIGKQWGTINCEAIRHDLQEYYVTPAAARGLAHEELIRRSRKFVALAQRHAPHWLEETRAIAEAAGVDADLYLSYVGNVYRGLWAGEECTSFAVSAEHTEEGRIFFHKNRDNQPKRQCAFVLDTDAPGVNKFIAVSDASVVACMMMVNEKGLAGSADVGGLRVKTPRYRGWMNTALLRHIAERASDCEDALHIVQEFVASGNYAGGGAAGTHWLFVDGAGKVLEVSNNSTRVEHRYHDEKVYFSASRGAAVQRMHDLPDPVDFAAFHNVSRDPATCFPTTVSGMSVEISRDHPDMLTVAWVAMPASGLAFPLFMGGTRTPVALLNGDADALTRLQTRDFRSWEPIEGFAFLSQRLLERRVHGLLDAGQGQAAREALDQWVAASVRAHLAAMSQ